MGVRASLRVLQRGGAAEAKQLSQMKGRQRHAMHLHRPEHRAEVWPSVREYVPPGHKSSQDAFPEVLETP
jgi:hypothetical protein